MRPGGYEPEGGARRSWGQRLEPAVASIRREAETIGAALGFLLSLGSAVFFGSYVLPRRYSSLDPWAYTAAMGLALAVMGALLWFGLTLGGHGALNAGALRRCALAGLVWASANVAQILAIDRVGVARANAFKNLAALFGTAFGLWLTGERLVPTGAAAVSAGSLLVVVAALAVGGSAGGRGMPGAASGRAGLDPFGVCAGMLAAAGIGYYLVPGLPVVASSPWGWAQFQAVLALAGGVLSTLPWLARQALRGRGPAGAGARGWGSMAPPLLAGVCWFVGSSLVTPAAVLIGLAISWPLSQLSFFVTLFWGVAVFHEIDLARGWRRVWLGGACSLLALALFGFARA